MNRYRHDSRAASYPMNVHMLCDGTFLPIGQINKLIKYNS